LNDRADPAAGEDWASPERVLQLADDGGRVIGASDRRGMPDETPAIEHGGPNVRY